MLNDYQAVEVQLVAHLVVADASPCWRYGGSVQLTATEPAKAAGVTEAEWLIADVEPRPPSCRIFNPTTRKFKTVLATQVQPSTNRGLPTIFEKLDTHAMFRHAQEILDESLGFLVPNISLLRALTLKILTSVIESAEVADVSHGVSNWPSFVRFASTCKVPSPSM